MPSRAPMDISTVAGGSVLLPCYCTDLRSKPERLIWNKHNRTTNQLDIISSESYGYRKRIQLFNHLSPANLSLLISHLTEEDAGDYWCDVENDKYVFIKLKIEAEFREQSSPSSSLTPTKDTRLVKTPETSMYYLIFLPPLLLLLGAGGAVFHKYRGQRLGQMESRDQRGRRREEQETQDQVMYSTIVHSNTTRTSTVIGTGEKIEYATIRLN
ncbi:CMRF35-like molecule 6 [Astyanax mexicanus]|uniref:CMRF35-like molecule 6 n=1 Tax=Astyanax mexicanus TaxID=7994 RepID=UPI0020CB5F5F|nr:CMRF35-like molecule 6 [Astyanax mexicanus]